MEPLAPATTGFLPGHLYEGPELERAQEICAAINAFGLETMGLAKADPANVRHLSLRQMLDAFAVVERWNDRPHTNGVSHSICMVPAERLVAAVYTLVHFADPSPCGDEDDDTLPARFTQRRWGDDFVHFLLIGSREKGEIEEDDA